MFPSDHYVVEFEIILKFKRAKRVTRQFYDFKNGNFDSLRDSLTRLPFEVAVSADVNEHWSNWKDLFLTAVQEHIPFKTVGDKNSPPWIDGEQIARTEAEAPQTKSKHQIPSAVRTPAILSQNRSVFQSQPERILELPQSVHGRTLMH